MVKLDFDKNELKIGDRVVVGHSGAGYDRLSIGHIVALNPKTAKVRLDDPETGKPEIKFYGGGFYDDDVKYFNLVRIGEK